MDNKLSELSKPVGRFAFEPLAERWYHIKHSEKQNLEGGPWELKKFYSQEYVSALLADNEGMEQSLNIANDATRLWKERAKATESKLESVQAIANEYQQLMYHMDAGGDFFEFQRDKNNG